MKIKIIALAFLALALSGMASAQTVSQMICHPLDKTNNYIGPNESMIGDQVCHVEAVTTQVIQKTVSVNVQKDVNVNANLTTNAPTVSTVQSPCIIVSGEQHRVNGGAGMVGMIAFAASKGKWQYIDGYNLQPQFVKTKYAEKDVTEMIKAGIHVIVTHSPNEVRDARISCQGQVSQK